MIDFTQMVSTDKFEKIKNMGLNTESDEFDYKEVFKFDTKGKVELLKDIYAFANTKGGYIIYGVTNSFSWIGLDDRSDETIDDTSIHQAIENYIEGKIDVVFNEIDYDGKEFLLFYIKPSKGILTAKKNGAYEVKSRKGKQSTKFAFRENDVYCRRGSRSIKADAIYYKQKKHNFKIVENISTTSKRYNNFIGRSLDLKKLHSLVSHPNVNLVQVDGIGGIGKTTLVHHYCEKLIAENDDYNLPFEFMIWMSAKRTEYTAKGIREIKRFLTNYEDVINEIVSFLEISVDSLDDESESDEEKVKQFLSSHKVLLIIDNMETLIDEDLIDLLQNLPRQSKAILTTRETASDWQMAKHSVEGFPELEFIDFMNSEHERLTSKKLSSVILNKIDKVYKYTKGMPLAGKLIIDQLSNNTDINYIIRGLEKGTTYSELLKFCFDGTLKKLSADEKSVLYTFSLTENDQFLTVDDLVYITGLDHDTIGGKVLPKLTKHSLCFSKENSEFGIGYTSPYLSKVHVKNMKNIPKRELVLEKFEKFIGEQLLIEDTTINDEKFFARIYAISHEEKLSARKIENVFDIYFNSGIDAALLLLDSEINDLPNFGYLRYMRGKIYDASKVDQSYPNARQNYVKATKLEPRLIEAWIDLGFLDIRQKSSKKNRQKELLSNQKSYFENALKIDDSNNRANLGYAITLTELSRRLSHRNQKLEKISTAREANDYFEKVYQNSDSQNRRHDKLIGMAYHKHASNLAYNLRDFDTAFEICKKGKNKFPLDKKLQHLYEEIRIKINPEKIKEEAIEMLRSKGWMK